MKTIISERYWKCHKLAQKHDWKLFDFQKNIYMVSFKKQINNSSARINIYLSKMTVTTVINHPKRGRNSLFRKKVDFEELEKIFENPRIHTGKGYRIKAKFDLFI